MPVTSFIRFDMSVLPQTDQYEQVTWTYYSSIHGFSQEGFSVSTQGTSTPTGYPNSLRGPAVPDGGSWYVMATWNQYTYDYAYWYQKVSSEASHDYLHVDMLNTYYFGSSEYVDWITASGNGSWSSRSQYFGPNTTHIKWRYTKDASGSSNNDTFYIGDFRLNQVVLPGVNIHNWAPPVAQAMAYANYPSTVVVVNAPCASASATAYGTYKVRIGGALAQATASALTSRPPGDTFASPLAMSSTSGSRVISLLNATVETGEPAVALGAMSATVWLTYTPPGSGTLTVAAGEAGYNVGLEEFQVTPVDTVDNLVAPQVSAGAPATMSVGVAGGIEYRFRVYPSGSTQHVAVPVTWSFAVRDDTVLAFQVNNNVAWTPSTVNVSLSNAAVNTQADFYIDGVFVTSYTTDGLGNITNYDVPLGPLTTGTHSIEVICNAKTYSGTFQVLYGVLGGTDTFPSDAPPPTVSTDVVQYWRLYDPHVGGETYVFEQNPAEMSSMIAPRALEVDTTTSFSGQALTWEGSRKPIPFTFTGQLKTQTQLEALDRFTQLNRRIYLVDHNRDAWVVTLEHFDAEAQNSPSTPWLHKYTVHGICFFGPVTLP